MWRIYYIKKHPHRPFHVIPAESMWQRRNLPAAGVGVRGQSSVWHHADQGITRLNVDALTWSRPGSDRCKCVSASWVCRKHIFVFWGQKGILPSFSCDWNLKHRLKSCLVCKISRKTVGSPSFCPPAHGVRNAADWDHNSAWWSFKLQTQRQLGRRIPEFNLCLKLH